MTGNCCNVRGHESASWRTAMIITFVDRIWKDNKVTWWNTGDVESSHPSRISTTIKVLQHLMKLLPSKLEDSYDHHICRSYLERQQSNLVEHWRC
ncbi:hypothetical protein J6590_042759 [Homalodisca vitripennis]|nr:hypothetical protein J6590_042759 [Homalodisca vitripennis]